MHVREHTTQRDGLRFSHRIIEHPAPRVTPTLFVSGAFQTMNSWARFARAFASQTSVLLVDPPGMGDSDALPPEVGVDYLTACVEQVLDEHRIERVSIVAASYGTVSAFRFAQIHPDRVDRLVLAGTMKAVPSHMRERIAGTLFLARRADRRALADEAVDAMLCHDPATPVDRLAYAARVLRGGILRMTDADLRKYAFNTERLLRHTSLDLSTTICGPEALVLTGEHDRFTPPDECRLVAEAFERAWFTTVRRADHLLHLQQWETVIDLVLGFVAGTLGLEGVPGSYPLERVGMRRAPMQSMVA